MDDSVLMLVNAFTSRARRGLPAGGAAEVPASLVPRSPADIIPLDSSRGREDELFSAAMPSHCRNWAAPFIPSDRSHPSGLRVELDESLHRRTHPVVSWRSVHRGDPFLVALLRHLDPAKVDRSPARRSGLKQLRDVIPSSRSRCPRERSSCSHSSSRTGVAGCGRAGSTARSGGYR